MSSSSSSTSKTGIGSFAKHVLFVWLPLLNHDSGGDMKALGKQAPPSGMETTLATVSIHEGSNDAGSSAARKLFGVDRDFKIFVCGNYPHFARACPGSNLLGVMTICRLV